MTDNKLSAPKRRTCAEVQKLVAEFMAGVYAAASFVGVGV